MAVTVNLEGRAIVVAGVGPGLGLTLVNYLASQCRADVIALVKDEEVLERIPPTTVRYHVDLTDEQKTESVFADINSHHPRGIQGLVNNAYVPFVIDDETQIPDITKEDFRYVFENNVYSAFRATQLAVPLIRKSVPVMVEETPVHGTIVTLSSNVSEVFRHISHFMGLLKQL